MSEGTDKSNQFRRSSRAVAKPNFRALDGGGGGEEEDADWSSEDVETDFSGRKKRRGGSKNHGSARSRQRKTAAVGDLEAAAQEAEAAVAELAPQAEAWKEKYTTLVKENEALKKRVDELMQKANQGAAMPHSRPPLPASAPLPPPPPGAEAAKPTARNTAHPLDLLDLSVPPANNGVVAPVALHSFGSPLSTELQLPAAAIAPLEQLPPPLQQQQQE